MQATEEQRDAQMTVEGTGQERRVWPRIPADELQHVKARLATGGEVTLRDLSRTGARLESTRRMLPNSSISLTLVTPEGSVVMTGLIVRSRIVRLAQGLGYDLAVAFGQLLQLPGMPAGELKTSVTADPATESTDPNPGAAAVPASGREATLQVTADVASANALHNLLDGNGW